MIDAPRMRSEAERESGRCPSCGMYYICECGLLQSIPSQPEPPIVYDDPIGRMRMAAYCVIASIVLVGMVLAAALL